MKRSVKAFMTVAVCILTASLILAGCSKEKNKTKDAISSSETGTKAPGENVKLSIMFSKNSADDPFYGWMQENISLYKEAHPNVEFDITANASGDDYLTVVNTQMAANNMPDIFQGWTLERMRPFAESGRLLDLTEAINGDAEWKQFLQADPLKSTTFNGGIYGIPSTLDAEVIYYNKEVFAKHSLQEPQTYDELIKIIDTLKASGITPLTIPNKDVWPGPIPFMMLAERIGGLEMYQSIVMDKTSPWNSEPMVEAGKKLQELMKLGAFEKDVNSVAYNEAISKLIEGKAGMFATGTWELAGLYNKMGDNVGFFNFPDIPGGKGSKDHYLTIPNVALSISKDSKHSEEAVNFLKFVFSQDRQVAFAKLGFLGTTNVKLGENDMNPLAKAIFDATSQSTGSMYPWDVPLGAFMGTELNNSIQMLYLNIDPVKVFDGLQAKQDSKKK